MKIFLIVIDQVTKYCAYNIVIQEISFKFWCFGLKYITHQKFYFFNVVAFDDPGKIISSIIASVVLLCIFLVYRFLVSHFPSRRLFTLAFIFCSGGLFSNLTDTIFLGHARDFIVFWKLGITNFADIFYWVGLALFLFGLFSDSKIRKRLNRFSMADAKIFFKFVLDEFKKLITLPKKLFSIIAKRNQR